MPRNSTALRLVAKRALSAGLSGALVAGAFGGISFWNFGVLAAQVYYQTGYGPPPDFSVLMRVEHPWVPYLLPFIAGAVGACCWTIRVVGTTNSNSQIQKDWRELLKLSLVIGVGGTAGFLVSLVAVLWPALYKAHVLRSPPGFPGILYVVPYYVPGADVPYPFSQSLWIIPAGIFIGSVWGGMAALPHRKPDK